MSRRCIVCGYFEGSTFCPEVCQNIECMGGHKFAGDKEEMMTKSCPVSVDKGFWVKRLREIADGFEAGTIKLLATSSVHLSVDETFSLTLDGRLGENVGFSLKYEEVRWNL